MRPCIKSISLAGWKWSHKIHDLARWAHQPPLRCAFNHLRELFPGKDHPSYLHRTKALEEMLIQWELENSAWSSRLLKIQAILRRDRAAAKNHQLEEVNWQSFYKTGKQMKLLVTGSLFPWQIQTLFIKKQKKSTKEMIRIQRKLKKQWKWSSRQSVRREPWGTSGNASPHYLKMYQEITAGLGQTAKSTCQII